MASRAETWGSVARQRFEALLGEIERSCSAERETHTQEAANGARRRFAEDLNQGLRRLRTAESVEQTTAFVVELAGPFCGPAAVFLFRDGVAEAAAARGLGELPLRFSPNDAAAFQTAIASGDPVIAIGTAMEISPELADRFHAENPERVHLFPLTVRGEVKAVLMAARTSEPSALELIANFGAIRLESIIPAAPAQRQDLVSIAPATDAAPRPSHEAKAEPRTNVRPAGWAELTPDLQSLHVRAQRFARRAVAQIRLAHENPLRQAVGASRIYAALREPIDRAREEFRRDYLSKSSTMVDYLFLEMVRSLAEDDERRLGDEFPGPLI